MIILRIGKERLQVPSRWEEITLGKAIEISQVAIPAGLEKFLLDEHYTPTAEEVYKTFPIYYGTIFQLLTGASDDLMRHTSPTDRTLLWDEYIGRIAISLWLGTPLFDKGVVKELKGFVHNRHMYTMPEVLTIYGQKVPFAELSTMEFAELSDLYVAAMKFRDEGWQHVPYLIAVTVREDGQPYDEKRALQMAESFEDLPMSVVWGFFQSWVATSIGYLEYTANSIAEEVRKERQKGLPHWFTNSLLRKWRGIIRKLRK